MVQPANARRCLQQLAAQHFFGIDIVADLTTRPRASRNDEAPGARVSIRQRPIDAFDNHAGQQGRRCSLARRQAHRAHAMRLRDVSEPLRIRDGHARSLVGQAAKPLPLSERKHQRQVCLRHGVVCTHDDGVALAAPVLRSQDVAHVPKLHDTATKLSRCGRQRRCRMALRKVEVPARGMPVIHRLQAQRSSLALRLYAACLLLLALPLLLFPPLAFFRVSRPVAAVAVGVGVGVARVVRSPGGIALVG
mmetsp:Transcript_13188/g.46137  ORF Transcript_13188/g.46137 Transcript_13188/m.46137 type:complete len:249 (+) Transcript_13188:1960-2706(+)